jgi:hypothetical protein
VAGQALGHLNLTFIAVPPLMLYVLDRLIISERGSARGNGALLGLLAALQLLISPEILIDSLVMTVAGIGVLIAVRPHEVRRRMRRVGTGFGWSALVALPLVAWPLLDYFTGPARYLGSPWHGYTYPQDLLGLVVPSVNQQFAPGWFAGIGNRFIDGDLAENGIYLGVLLLAFLTVLVVRFRRSGVMRFAAIMAVIAWVLSLGPRLVIDQHTTAVRLPFDLFLHLPVLNAILAGRYALFVDLFAGLVLAVGLDRMHAAVRRHTRRPAALSQLGMVGLAVITLLPLVPRWPYPSVEADVPAFFTTDSVKSIPAGSPALIYPYPAAPFNQAMIWQAAASMRFRLLGGYVLIPGAGRVATDAPAPIEPRSVPNTLLADFLGTPAPASPATPDDVRALVHRYRVGAVVLQWAGARPAAALGLLTGALGPPRHQGGVYVWVNPGAHGP